MAQSTWDIDPAHSRGAVSGETPDDQQRPRACSTKCLGKSHFPTERIMQPFKPRRDRRCLNRHTRIEARRASRAAPTSLTQLLSPKITFKSKRVEGISGNKFNLVGDLTMRGVTKEIILNVEATPIIKRHGRRSAHRRPGYRQAEPSGLRRQMETALLMRSMVVGDEVPNHPGSGAYSGEVMGAS